MELILRFIKEKEAPFIGGASSFLTHQLLFIYTFLTITIFPVQFWSRYSVYKSAAPVVQKARDK